MLALVLDLVEEVAEDPLDALDGVVLLGDLLVDDLLVSLPPVEGDAEDVEQHHALEGVGQVGDEVALAPLDDLVDGPRHRLLETGPAGGDGAGAEPGVGDAAQRQRVGRVHLEEPDAEGVLGDADAAVDRYVVVVDEALGRERLVVAERLFHVGVLEEHVVPVVQVGVQHRALGPRRAVGLTPGAGELGGVMVELGHAGVSLLTKHPLVS